MLFGHKHFFEIFRVLLFLLAIAVCFCLPAVSTVYASPSSLENQSNLSTASLLALENYQGGPDMPRNTLILIGLICLGLLAVVVIVFITVILIRRRGNRTGGKTSAEMGGSSTIEENYAFKTAETPPGLLRVLDSEDPMMVGKSINLMHPFTTIGRDANNDIVLPLDKSVSRRHAVIERSGAVFYLKESVSSDHEGEEKRPSYGTFINNQKVGDQPVRLETGDEIQLGTRFKMRFENVENSSGSEILDGKGR